MERNRMLHCLSIEPDDVVFFPRPPFLENLLCDAMSCSTVATKKKSQGKSASEKKDKNARGVEQNDIKKPAGQSTLLFPKKKRASPSGIGKQTTKYPPVNDRLHDALFATPLHRRTMNRYVVYPPMSANAASAATMAANHAYPSLSSDSHQHYFFPRIGNRHTALSCPGTWTFIPQRPDRRSVTVQHQKRDMKGKQETGPHL